MELKFSEHFIAEDVCLFEIPNESLLQALMEEQGVEIRGKQGCESSVLVTKDSTFEIRSVESSNSQLLLQTSLESINDAASSEIFHSVSQHFELVKIPPRLHELFRILSETAIRDARSVSGGLTLAEIQNEVESSDSEILQGLKNFGAWMRDDRGKETARMIEFDLSARLLLVALDFAVSNGWTRIQDGEPLYEIPYTGFINAFADEKSLFDEIPADVVWRCLCNFTLRFLFTVLYPQEIFLSVNHSSECSENSHVIVMDKEKILRTLAKRTLRTFSDHCCSEEDFLKSFRDDLPLYFTPSLDCLKGVAFRRILDDQSIVWQHLDISELSNDPEIRFRQLFNFSPSLSQDDLRAYFRDFEMMGHSVEALMLKYGSEHKLSISIP